MLRHTEFTTYPCGRGFLTLTAMKLHISMSLVCHRSADERYFATAGSMTNICKLTTVHLLKQYSKVLHSAHPTAISHQPLPTQKQAVGVDFNRPRLFARRDTGRCAGVHPAHEPADMPATVANALITRTPSILHPIYSLFAVKQW